MNHVYNASSQRLGGFKEARRAANSPTALKEHPKPSVRKSKGLMRSERILGRKRGKPESAKSHTTRKRRDRAERKADGKDCKQPPKDQNQQGKK